MEKGHHSSTESAATSSDHFLKHLNKLSHKISKPPLKKHPLDSLPDQPDQSSAQGPSPAVVNQTQSVQLQAPPPPQAQPPQQPPVYNINKNDFRDVVQKLTGSTSHERAPTPPQPQPQQQQQQQQQQQHPVPATKPPSSRLHRIRPPPLAQLINRPSGLVPQQQQSSMLNPDILLPMNSLNATMNSNYVIGSSFNPIGRPVAPLSPLPPLPSVHAAAESPVSAYMRRLQSSMAAVDPRPDQFTGFGPPANLASPRWSNLAPPAPPQQQVAAPGQGLIPPPPEPAAPLQLPPSSPMPFGCLNSPRSAYPLLSPGFLFSPTSGQLGFPQLPLSPTVPVPSPGDRGL